jgi:gamma-glutamyltranspeptidase
VADYFYRGPLAREMDAWMQANGGLIRYSDLADHVTRIEEPLSIDYRGYTVYKCGFWTQGPYFLQMLRMLEGYDLKAMGYNRPDTVHLMLEVSKLALADRDMHYADPHFADVPSTQLLSREYAEKRRSLIDMSKASDKQLPGDPRKLLAVLENPVFPTGPESTNKDTSTCLTIDRWGNAVAITPSGFDGVTAGKTGVVFGTRLRSFNAVAGHANCIEPGKRPRITLSPGMGPQGRQVLPVPLVRGRRSPGPNAHSVFRRCCRFRQASAGSGQRAALRHVPVRQLVRPGAGQARDSRGQRFHWRRCDLGLEGARRQGDDASGPMGGPGDDPGRS